MSSLEAAPVRAEFSGWRARPSLAWLKDRLSRSALAPFTIPIFVAAPLWQENMLRLPFQDLLPSLATMLVLVGLLLAVIYAFQRDWRRASLTTLLWTAFLVYPPSVAELITDSDLAQRLLILAVAVVAWDVGRKIPKEPERLNRVNFVANIATVPAALAIVGAAAAQIAVLESSRPDPREVFAPFTGAATAQSPDVWHIVMDRYANSDTLARVYGYDNRPFLDELRKRGFAVSEDAHSNYQFTAPSLASATNAGHLDQLAHAGARGDDQIPLFRAVRQSQAMRFFQRQGYRTIFASTRAHVTVRSEIADLNINYRDLSETERLMLGLTLPGMIGRAVGAPYSDARGDQCQREKIKFDELRKVAHGSDRKYVFAHFLVPHPPFVFAADGTCRSAKAEVTSSRTVNYTGQVTYANRELLRLIDAILAGPRPATIVLHADEGPYPEENAIDEIGNRNPTAPRDWTGIGRDKLREKTGILMAIRHADGMTSEAPPTPVNIYPLILNRSFGADMPMQPERTYIFPTIRNLYQLSDMTDAIR